MKKPMVYASAMTGYRYAYVLLGLVLFVSSGSQAQTPEAAGGCSSPDDLAWMLGSWRQETSGTVFIEQWRREADGSFVGHAESFAADGSEMYMQEDMVLKVEAGTLVYAADPNKDGVWTQFPLLSCEEQSAIFENPEHDFPQRLSYRTNEEGGLDASVTDLKGQGFDLRFLPDTD